MKKHLFFPLCLFFLLAASLFNCKGPTGPEPLPGIGTSIAPAFEGSGSCEFENLTRDFVRVSSTLRSPGSNRIIQHGHVWSSVIAYPLVDRNSSQRLNYSDTLNYSELGEISANGANPYTFTSYLESLKAGTTYYVRAYVTTKDGTYYGDPVQFKTLTDVSN